MISIPEEVYSKSIVQNILEELSENINQEEDYGSCELLVDTELQLYKVAFPNVDIERIEDIVRGYFFNHNYLSYRKLIEGKSIVEYDEDSDSIYVRLDYDINDGCEVFDTITVDGLIVDVSKEGLVLGVEIIGVCDFLRWNELDYVEDIKWVCVDFVVRDFGVELYVGFNLVKVDSEPSLGRLRQEWCKFVFDVDGDFVGLKCVCR